MVLRRIVGKTCAFSPLLSFGVSNSLPHHIFCRHSSHRCSFAKQFCSTYPRMYKVQLFLEDGSSITVRSEKPRKFIQFPIDLAMLNENEQRKLWLSRKTKVKTTEDESEMDDDFKSSKYQKFWK